MSDSYRRAIGTFAACAVGAILLGAGQAHAGTIEIFGDASQSTEALGDYSGSLDYSANPVDGYGMLVVSLTNTSDPGNGGFITGFVFNIDSSDASASAELLAGATHPFANLSGSGLSAEPFGMFDGGAALGGSFLGGGNPNPGISVGETGVFEFKIVASDFLALDVSSFLSESSDEDLIVRFRGFDDDGSDKVPGTVVPLPAPVLLGSVGLLAVAGMRRRMQRR